MRAAEEKGQTEGHSRYATKKDVYKPYLNPRQTQSYLASLEAKEMISRQTRAQHITEGRNPILELRRALKEGLDRNL